MESNQTEIATTEQEVRERREYQTALHKLEVQHRLLMKGRMKLDHRMAENEDEQNALRMAYDGIHKIVREKDTFDHELHQ